MKNIYYMEAGIMRNYLKALSIIFILMNTAPVQALDPTVLEPEILDTEGPSEDIKILINKNREFIRLWTSQFTKADDEKNFRALLAEDMVYIGPDGRIFSREEYIKLFIENSKKLIPPMTEYNNGRFSVKIYGDYAIISAHSYYRRIIDGIPEYGGGTYLDSYRKRNGKWEVIVANFYPYPNGKVPLLTQRAP